jgi:hypothetical protein
VRFQAAERFQPALAAVWRVYHGRLARLYRRALRRSRIPQEEELLPEDELE